MTKGLDLSSWQHPNGAAVDYAAVKAAGYQWVALKLTEWGSGGQYVNPYADADRTGFHAAGLEVWLYHFAHPELRAHDSEAGFFGQHAAGWPNVALDIEKGDTLGWGALAAWVHDFDAYYRQGLFYVDRSYRDGLTGAGFDFTGRLWLAAPDVDDPGPGVTVWQHGQGMVPGIPDPVDLDTILGGAPPPPNGGSGHVDVSLEVLREGSTGGAVSALQSLLNGRHGAGLAIDGAFGPHTDAAVRAWQQYAGIGVDGIVGHDTWTHLLS